MSTGKLGGYVGILIAWWCWPAWGTPPPALPLQATALEARAVPRETPPRGLPPPGRVSVPRIGQEWDEWDGMPRRFLTFTVPGLALRLPGSVMDYWVEARSPAPGLPGYSAVHRWNDAMRFTFTLARSEVFLPTLDRADWAAYLAHLSQAPGRLLLADDDSATNPHMLTLLGARTRFLAYWDPARDGGADQLTWQTVLQHCGYTVVLTMTAPYSTLVEIPALYEALVMGLEEAAGR